MVAALTSWLGLGCGCGPDSLLPWQGSGGGTDVQIPCGLEIRVAASVCLLRGVWEAGPSCDEEGELGGRWGLGRKWHLVFWTVGS